MPLVPYDGYGVYLGRFAPFHLGHLAVLEQMYKNHGPKKSLIIIGSSNAISERTPWNYSVRKQLIQTVLQVKGWNIPIVGLSDQPDQDGLWLETFRDIIWAVHRYRDSQDVSLYCGKPQETIPALADMFNLKFIINNATSEISGTTIRNCTKSYSDIKNQVPAPITEVVFNLIKK